MEASTDTTDLITPLLMPLSVSDDFVWPAEEAGRAKLFVPQEYDPYQDRETPGTCHFEFDRERNMFVVISDATGDILDAIDHRDVIGVDLEVQLLNGVERSWQQQDTNLKSTSQTNNTRDNNEPMSDTPVDRQGSAVLTLFVYPKRDLRKQSIFNSCGLHRKTQPNRSFPSDRDTTEETSKPMGYRYEHHRKFTVAPAEAMDDLSKMVQAIRTIVRPPSGLSSKRSERLLVIANPVSGKKKALQVYQKIVAPLLEQAGIAHDYLITTHPRHAQERMQKQPTNGDLRDLSDYASVVTIGGDGVVHEIMQGIHHRPDRATILKTIKLGMVGTGTSNGLSATLAHASEEKFSPLDSAFMIAKGKTAWMDLSLYETQTRSYTSFLTFSWGYIADIDIESEAIRFMGFLRMDIWGAWRVLNLRKYRAKFSYLPPTKERRATTLPPLSESLPDNEGWVVTEDVFILFWASQVTHAGEQMFHAPNCKIDDGVFNIFLVRGNVSRFRLALIALAMEHGGHIDMPGAEFVECVAYRLEPISPGSFNDLDGEVIESGPVQGAVLPSAMQAYCNP